MSGVLLPPPRVEHSIVEDHVLEVLVRFPPGSDEESGQIWWMYDAGWQPRLSQRDDTRRKFRRNALRSRKRTLGFEMELDPEASHIDFFQQSSKDDSSLLAKLCDLYLQSVHPC